MQQTGSEQRDPVSLQYERCPSAPSFAAQMQVLMPEPQIFVERTLALIKPDAVDKEEEIVDLIRQSGFLIVQVTGCAPREVTAV